MKQRGRRASLALCLAVAVVWASAASARTERLRWTQSNATGVDNFKLYVGLSSGSLTTSLSVGVPPKDATGAYYYDLVVNDADTIYAAVSAFAGTLESTRSNVISRAGITGGGGGTTPPPSPSAAVLGFALWNASSDTVVDSSFTSGEAISDAIRSCAAIEIKGNSYLNANGAGSIKKVFDGQNNGCTGTGGENNAPFAWEDDAGTGAFPCAASLAVAGSHTLVVTPYDGDNCSGTAGSPVTLTFTVTGSTAPPAPTLGAPGQPYIVQ
jgi:hypothetical protein